MTTGDTVHRSPESTGVDRRRFLTLGGVSVLATAVMAACGSSKSSSSSGGTADSTTTTAPTTDNDINILRTASSLELAVIDGYQKIIDAKVVTTAGLVDALATFQTQHKQHSQLFANTTSGAGGEPYTEPNPVVMRVLLTPRLAAVKTEADALRLLYDLEHMLAASFQADIGTFADVTFNQKVSSVGGIEGAHAGYFAPSVGKPTTPDGAFGSVEGAVSPASIA